MTLRARLSLLVALVVFVGLPLFGGLAYGLFVAQQQAQLERLLMLDLSRVQALIQHPEAGARLVDANGGDFLLQFVAPDGQVVIPPEAEVLPLYTQPTMERSGGVPRLVASLPWLSPTGVTLGTLRLALDLEGALQARHNLLRSLLASGLFIALAATFTALLLLRRTLAPLLMLVAQARKIDPAHPQVTPYHGPADEVAELAGALNAALAGIRERQEAERASLAEIAHELAAPLTLVAGHLGSLAQRRRDPRLQAARDAAYELLYTSQDLLTLARGELESPIDLQIVNLSEVIERVASEYPGVKALVPERAELAGSPQRLAQLVRNLVRNAVQASGSVEGVTLRLVSSEERLLLSVRDEGPGIAAEDLPRIFERFYTRRGGVGVGLSVAQRIAQGHGGTIRVDSAVGEGTCFYVSLPSLVVSLDAVEAPQEAVEFEPKEPSR